MPVLETIDEFIVSAYAYAVALFTVIYEITCSATNAESIPFFFVFGLFFGFLGLRFRTKAVKLYTFLMIFIILLVDEGKIDEGCTAVASFVKNIVGKEFFKWIPFGEKSLLAIVAFIATLILFLIFNNPQNFITFYLTASLLFWRTTGLLKNFSMLEDKDYTIVAVGILSLAITCIVFIPFPRLFVHITDFYLCLAGAIAIMGFAARNIQRIGDFFDEDDFIPNFIIGESGSFILPIMAILAAALILFVFQKLVWGNEPSLEQKTIEE